MVSLKARNFEEREVLETPAPIISKEKFNLTETLFLKGDLLPKSGKGVINRVP